MKLHLNQKEFARFCSPSLFKKYYQDYHHEKSKICTILIDLVEGLFVVVLGQRLVSTLPK